MIKEGRTVPRKGHTQKRDVLADPIYNNKVVTKLINNIMLDGKKGVAQKIVYGAFERVEAKAEKPAIEVFEEAMNNMMPVLEVKARRIGGATYQVPIEVRADRRQALALIMATMIRPDLLLLDEHTAALDPKSSDTVMMLTDKIVHEKNITTIMVTHNLRHAVEHGTRTVMMHNGEAIMDVSGAEKDNKTINDYLTVFNEISIECGN